MVQALALAEAFGVQVKIEYLDGHALVNGKVAQHVVGPEDAALHLTLLYRPGHYDILYPAATTTTTTTTTTSTTIAGDSSG
jgi:ubiquitin thioesterase protein OTUB1